MEDNDHPLWESVLKQLEILIPLSVLFLINRFVLVPKLLFKRRPKLFISSVLGVIVVLASATFLYNLNDKKPPASDEKRSDNRLRQPIDRPPPPDNAPQNDIPPGKRQPKPVPPFANFLIFSVLIVGFDTGLRSGLRWIEVENEKVRL